MAEIINTINSFPYNGISAAKLIANSSFESRLISLEKGAKLTPHISNKDALLVLLEGQIDFHIEETTFKLKPFQGLSFKKNETHWVDAIVNSKFLLLR
ncbi:MAG: hypothetical protein HKN00_01030 [Flavobacteriaceae bacterium]|nr:hypothetical protein [Bacteroidia bacterium]MBT8288419.1 hypothetical protein [Bacteroidia bacterium]NNF73739.1 hypothetical protein [Flavobacteriaceae bacterium]NNK73310.1 hypothetical protein [Flavobacteriaceae bacterium]